MDFVFTQKIIPQTAFQNCMRVARTFFFSVFLFMHSYYKFICILLLTHSSVIYHTHMLVFLTIQLLCLILRLKLLFRYLKYTVTFRY